MIEQKMTFAPLTKADFVILGSVSGRGEIIEDGKGKISGDTLRYGSINPDGTMGTAGAVVTTVNNAWWARLLAKIGISNVKKSVLAPKTVDEIALSNACYEMIIAAQKLNADFLLFPNYIKEISVDGTTVVTTITGRAVAAKLK